MHCLPRQLPCTACITSSLALSASPAPLHCLPRQLPCTACLASSLAVLTSLAIAPAPPKTVHPQRPWRAATRCQAVSGWGPGRGKGGGERQAGEGAAGQQETHGVATRSTDQPKGQGQFRCLLRPTAGPHLHQMQQIAMVCSLPKGPRPPPRPACQKIFLNPQGPLPPLSAPPSRPACSGHKDSQRNVQCG